MTDDNQPIDPVAHAAEQLLYGDPAAAAEHLRTAIRHEAAKQNAHQMRQGRLNATHARSLTSLQKFLDDNDAYRDPVVQSAGRTVMAQEQLHDLEAAGFDRQKFREANNRDLTEQDVFNAHLEFRANGVPGVRSDDELLDATAQHLEDKFGIKRRIANIDRSRKRGVDDRMRVAAAGRGMSLEEYEQQQLPSRMPSYDQYGGEPVTAQSIQQSTLAAFGDGVPAEADASRKANHRNAIQRMQAARAPSKLAPQVEVDMDRNSRRYPDRRQATG
jgi:hypothetical protein